ncbi:Nn.00g012320.m01.CDS01 [Neocucurbitaria sp. VM-36]
MFTKASIATLFASLAAAQLHAPVGEPSGNAITRPLNEVVPACTPFTITWQPTTPNTVSVLLLKGPSTNVVQFGPALAEGIANSGSLTWTPAADLEATTGPTGYGIQLIDDVTGQYQYSTQFGISKEGCAVVSSSSSLVPASSTSGGYPVSSLAPYPTKSSSKGGYPVSTGHYSASVTSKTTLIYSTGVPHGNTSVIQPTKPLTVPSSLKPSSTANATTSRLPEATGAASALQAGLSIAGAVAAFAFML